MTQEKTPIIKIPSYYSYTTPQPQLGIVASPEFFTLLIDDVKQALFNVDKQRGLITDKIEYNYDWVINATTYVFNYFLKIINPFVNIINFDKNNTFYCNLPYSTQIRTTHDWIHELRLILIHSGVSINYKYIQTLVTPKFAIVTCYTEERHHG